MKEDAPRVIKIPAKPEATRQADARRQLRVAAYCRVSTKEEDQANSYEVQKEYYTDKIMSNTAWTMAGIFADKGITGTSAKKREDFMRMIRHCRQKKIDVIWIYERYLTGASLRMIKEELEQQGVKCSEDSPEWTISRIRSILQNEKYCGDVLMQKTFRQDFINRKAIKNTGQLPMYLIENHHEGIVSREKYDAVQAEMARRNAAKSPSKNAVTGMASYASKYALSERLVCGECGTLYRRCTWTRNGKKRVVWRCVSRLDYGKKYCHNSPTLDEAPLQQAILAALNTAMADKNSLIRQITDAMETEIIPFPGGTMSLGDIERRLRELEQQFQTLLEKATNDPAAYGGQFKEILDEQTFLKEKRSVILANNNEQTKANQRIMDAAQTLENASLHITEWDESAVRQLVETVKILSKDEVAVTLKGGIEICQKIMY
jgi:site-specific DNA recombinase